MKMSDIYEKKPGLSGDWRNTVIIYATFDSYGWLTLYLINSSLIIYINHPLH